MTINELRSKRAKLWESTKAFLETHRRENGTLSAEDDATYAKMEQEISDLGREISRLERQEAMDAELSKPVNTPITTRPGAAKEETKNDNSAEALAARHKTLTSQIDAQKQKIEMPQLRICSPLLTGVSKPHWLPHR